jgi:DNA-binding TFAR19-related protein (PDSD5 family)
MDDLDDIREKKKKEIANEEEKERVEEQRQIEREEIINEIVDEDGRQRLNAVEMVNQELVEQIKDYLYQMYAHNKVNSRISEQEIIEILKELNSSEDDYNIKSRF